MDAGVPGVGGPLSEVLGGYVVWMAGGRGAGLEGVTVFWPGESLIPPIADSTIFVCGARALIVTPSVSYTCWSTGFGYR